MKKLYALLLLFFLSGLKAQTNLVPNPSFETYTICPNTAGQISEAVGWFAARMTPDYFNSCSAYGWSSIPLNYFGYQHPASGNAYSGAISDPNVNGQVEWIGTQLINSLQVGTKYYVSFKTSLGGLNSAGYCGINKLGALFSKTQYNNPQSLSFCDCAQIYTDSIIIDTLNWVRIKGSFVADSNYSYINIGKFFTNASSTQLSGTQENAYYYFDDICVSTDSIYSYTYTYITGIDNIKRNNSTNIYPNPFNNYITVESASEIEKLTIQNVYGGEIITIDKKDIQKNIDVSSLSSGVYIFKIVTKSNEIITNKLIKS